jgi:hypothetical protein
VPVTPDDLKAPLGELDPAVLWPGLSSGAVDTILEGYIEDGESRVGELTGDAADRSVTLWAEYRAYLAKYQAKLDEATTVTQSLVDQGSKTLSTLWSQVEAWKKLADEKLAAWGAVVGGATTAIVSRVPAPAVARLEYEW